MNAHLKCLAGAALALVLSPQASLAQQKTVTLMAYSGLFQERYTKAVVEPFMKANPDIKIEYFPLPNSAQMLGSLRAQKAAPQADVVIMDVSVSKAGTDENLFIKIDEKNVPAVVELYPTARIADVAGVAVTFDNLVLILDKARGGTNYLANVDKGIAALVEIAPNILTWEPKPEPYPVIIAGQAHLGAAWNARAQVNADISNGKLKATLPAEGSVFQINTINLVANRPDKDAAAKFVNYAIGATAQKAFTEEMFYAPVNSKAQIADTAIDRTAVKSMDKVVAVNWIGLAKVRDGIMEQWRRRVLPASR